MSTKSKLPQRVKYGTLELPNNIFYAPLAGCSDYPFRKMSRNASPIGPGLIFCEMVKMDALIRYDPGTFHLLDYSADMHPIGGQLCGAKVEIAGKAAKIIEELGFDVIDLNCGCPVDKVTKDGSGSGMLKNPELIGDIIANMVAAVKIPVTVKIRAGWDNNSIVAREITSIAEKAGAKAITIHGRTRSQGYKGPANWSWIKESKEVAKEILVIGNGDIYSPQDAFRMIEETNCDGVLVARGTLGQPWIAHDIVELSNGVIVVPKTLAEKREALLQHFGYIREYLPDRKVVIDMRRVGCWYFTKSKGTRAFREAISHATTVSEIEKLILEFPIEEGDAEEELSLVAGCAL